MLGLLQILIYVTLESTLYTRRGRSRERHVRDREADTERAKKWELGICKVGLAPGALNFTAGLAHVGTRTTYRVQNDGWLFISFLVVGSDYDS